MPSSSSSSHASSGSSSSNVWRRQGFNSLSSIRMWIEAAKRDGVRICKCGMECEYYTSMTNENPGRRFYRCPKLNGGCGFWEWYDKPLCGISSQLLLLLREEINGLRSALNVKDEEIEISESKLRGYYHQVAKLKRDLELAEHEIAHGLEENVKLQRESSSISVELADMKRKYRSLMMLVVISFFITMYFVNDRLYYVA